MRAYVCVSDDEILFNEKINKVFLFLQCGATGVYSECVVQEDRGKYEYRVWQNYCNTDIKHAQHSLVRHSFSNYCIQNYLL